MFPCNCRPPFPRPEPFSPLPRPGKVPDWGKWIRDRLAEKGALLAFPSASAFPSAGDGPNLYLAEDTGVLYRWDGKAYAVLFDPSASDVETYPGRSAFPDTGRTGAIYIDASANLLYRWDGTGYVLLTPDLSGVESRLAGVESKVPAQATAQNQLADKAFVNSSIATNTAFYITDNGRPFQSLADLESYEGALTNNDYAFVVGRDAAGNTTYTRYKWNEATEAWGEEYVLNNSSFTAEQWAAISSGVTSGLVAKLGALPTAEALAQALAGKASKADATLTPIYPGTPTFSEWTFSDVSDGITDIQQPVFIPSQGGEPRWNVGFVYDGHRTATAYTGEYATNLAFEYSDEGLNLHLTAIRTRTGVLGYRLGPDEQTNPNRDKPIASTAAATLTPIYSQTPTFSEWTFSRDNVSLSEPLEISEGLWGYHFTGDELNNYSDQKFSSEAEALVATDLTTTTVYGAPITATRTRTDIIGYHLGSQTDKPLASEAETEALRQGKQDALTFDNAPTSGSSNPVKSGGVWSALWGAATTAFSSIYDWVVSKLSEYRGKTDLNVYGYGDPVVRFADGFSVSYNAGAGSSEMRYTAPSGGETITFTGPVPSSNPNVPGYKFYYPSYLGNLDSFDPNDYSVWCLVCDNGGTIPSYMMYMTGPYYTIGSFDSGTPTLTLGMGEATGDAPVMTRTFGVTGDTLAKASQIPAVVAPSTSASDSGKAADAKATGDALAGKLSTRGGEMTPTFVSDAIPSGRVVFGRDAGGPYIGLAYGQNTAMLRTNGVEINGRSGALAASPATAGNLAALDASGNPTDSGVAKSGVESLFFAQYYPDGSVKSAAEFTQGIKYDAPDTTNRTITVKPFCDTGDSANDNSGLVGRVVIPPFVDAQGNGYISDGGTRFKVVGVSGVDSLVDANINLTAIVTPSTVASVGSLAFASCGRLDSISLPAATTIGYGAFAYCLTLASVDFGDTPRPTVPTLGSGAFNDVSETCRIVVPYTQYDEWKAASGWSTLQQEFVRHAEKADKPATFTTGNLATLDAQGNPTDSGVKASAKLDSTSAAPAFSADSSISYAVGSHCTYNGKLYKCTTATTGGTWVAESWVEDTMTDPDAALDITAQNQLRVIAKDGTVLWAQGYDLASTSSATLACDATNNFTFADGATTQAFALPTAPTGKVGDFGLDIDNSANTGAATMTLTGLDTIFSVVVPEGESLNDMLAIAAGELAQFYVTLTTFRVNNLPTWHIVKQVVENGGATA